MKTKLVLLIALLMLTAPAFSATPESTAILTIVSGIRAYQTLNGGRAPTNWTQVREIMDVDKLNAQTLANSPAYPIEENYVFIEQKIPVPSYPNGDVILIRKTPVQYEERKTGRYLISMIANEPSHRWMDETEVQQMLADAGATELPKPETVSVPKEQSSVKIPPPVNTATSQTALQDSGKPQLTHKDLPNPTASKNAQPSASNTVPLAVATEIPGNGTSWLGLIVVLGIGLLASIFLLFRAKQK